MRRLALHGLLRRQLTWLHRWSGLAVLAFLLIASVTGTWLVFHDELDRWINAELRVVAIREHRVPLREVYATVEGRFTGTRVTTIVTQKKPDDALFVYLASTDGRDLPYNLVFVDPYTGRILGQRSTTRLVFSKAHLNPLILKFHYTLFAGTWGLWLMGGCAIVWLLTNLIGLWLSWPQAWRRIVAWIPILSVRLNRGSYKVNYDLHRAVGMWLLPVFTVLAFTSVYLNLPNVIKPAVNAVSPLSTPPAGRPRGLEHASISPDTAIEIAKTIVPSARPNSVIRDTANGRYSVWLQRVDDVSPYGNNVVYIDFGTGDVTGVRLAKAGTAGDRFMDWQLPLHNGMAFGLVGRVVVVAAGIAMVALCVTGFYVWWRKWRDRRRARVRFGAAPAAVACSEQPDWRSTRAAARERVVLEPESAACTPMSPLMEEVR